MKKAENVILSRRGGGSGFGTKAENIKSSQVKMKKNRIWSLWGKGADMRSLQTSPVSFETEMTASTDFERSETMTTFDLISNSEDNHTEESAFRILKEAANGSLEKFKSFYISKPESLHFEDSNGAGPLHHAASKSQISIMEFIINNGGDIINAQDKSGDTALHWAVSRDQKESIEFLIKKGADTSILNKNNDSALHLAVEIGMETTVEALCSHSEVDTNIKGDMGLTPLHYCAIRDNDKIAEILLKHKALLCTRDNNGVFPAHCAATHASARVLEILLLKAEECGYKRSEILSYVDKENNSPIHSAVNGGNKEAIKLCLDNGSRIDLAQGDGKNTPVHLASSQGALEIIDLMLKSTTCKEMGHKALTVKDAQDMLPIHRAAMFDHKEVVEYLIEEGSPLDPVDYENRTPLLLATSKGGWRTVQYLLEKGASFRHKDKKKRNILHLAIIQGNSLSNCDLYCLKKKEVMELLMNEKDACGCTPLHYASMEGSIRNTENLIKLGATLNPKNHLQESPIHFAARYGRFNTCRHLLNSNLGKLMINEKNRHGRTPLHVAALHGQTKIVNLLMRCGALLHNDYEGRSPLHLAAMSGYIKTMEALLATHGHLIDQTDDDDNTALHLATKEVKPAAVSFLLSQNASIERNSACQAAIDIAIKEKSRDVAMAFVTHDRWHEVLSGGSSCSLSAEERYPMPGLIENLPDVCMTVLDRCQTFSEGVDFKSDEYWVKYDFKYLECNQESSDGSGKPAPPLPALNKMVQFNRVDLLSHPLCVNYIRTKWNSYGKWIHIANIIDYAIFLVLITSFVTTVDPKPLINYYNNTINNSAESQLLTHTSVKDFLQWQRASVYVIAGLSVISMLKEIIQLIQQGGKYFLDLTNYLEWTLYLTASFFVFPYIFGNSFHYQWECGAVVTFLAWFNFLLFLQRFDLIGIYIVMFLEILKTLIQVILVFSVLIIAFGLSFYILLSQEENKANSTPGYSIYRTFIMMLGEIDYVNSYVEPSTDDDPYTMHYKGLTYFFLVIFVLFMPILLMNLLIGLAVGDIATVQKDANLKRLAMQVELHTDLEHKLPKGFLKKVNKSSKTYYPNRCDSDSFFKLWQRMRKSAGFEDEFEILANRQSMNENPPTAALHEELLKQKKRLKDISGQMEKQFELMRLVVQKMEIRTEADDWDEGESTSQSKSRSMASIVKGTMPIVKMMQKHKNK